MFKKMDEVMKKIYTIDSRYFTTDGKTVEENDENVTPSLLQDFDTFINNINSRILINDIESNINININN
jgi:hypothetical protein